MDERVEEAVEDRNKGEKQAQIEGRQEPACGKDELFDEVLNFLHGANIPHLHKFVGAMTEIVSVKIRIFVAALLAIAALPTAQAAPAPKTLVIIDTGFNAADPIIAAHTIHEVCIMDWYACPNGSNFQETPTAAMLTPSQLNGSGFIHGSKMARGAIAAYPDVQLILMRIIGQSSSGSRLSTSEAIVGKALAWVSKNAATYNIGAVAMSQGSSRAGTNARRCLSAPAVEKEIRSLKIKGIYTFFPTGNEGNSTFINWPACIADSVAVGATDKKGQIASYSNFAPGQVDIHEQGYPMEETATPVYSYENGTSYSVQFAAARWLSLVNAFPDKRASQIFWTYAYSGLPISSARGASGWAVNIDEARASLSSG